MCINPATDHNGNTIWCRKCWRCKKNRINDWVGRCVAESRYATSAHAVTLTYGRDRNGESDHIHAALLLYRDVQTYFKRLRKAGYKFKYLVAGEYGTKKRRAHWHLVIFWDGASPQVELGSNFDHEYWTWGHTFWEMMTPEAASYVVKYIQKDQAEDEAEAMLRMSKKPPLGHEWFQRRARQYVEQGLAPQTLKYDFAGVRHKSGKRREFYMHGVTADNFLREYCRYFAVTNGHLRMPASELVEEWIDQRYARHFETENWIREKGYGKAIVEKIHQEELARRAEAHGGIYAFYPALIQFRPELSHAPALAVCHDGTHLEYGPDTEKDRVQEFLDVIQT